MKSAGQDSAFRTRTRSGFTLIELLVTVAVIAIAAAAALPSFREFGTRMATRDNNNQLVGALNVARSEAVKRGRPVAVMANGGNWNNGWQVVAAKETAGAGGVIVIQSVPTSPGNSAALCASYLDNAVVSTSTVPLCLQHRDAMTGGFTLKGKGDGSDIMVIYDATGSLRDGKPFDFSVCRPSDQADANESYRIHVAGSGIIESRRGTSGAPAGACT